MGAFTGAYFLTTDHLLPIPSITYYYFKSLSLIPKKSYVVQMKYKRNYHMMLKKIDIFLNWYSKWRFSLRTNEHFLHNLFDLSVCFHATKGFMILLYINFQKTFLFFNFRIFSLDVTNSYCIYVISTRIVITTSAWKWYI